MDKNIEDLVKTTTRGSLILLLGQISSTLILAAGMLLVARFLGPVKFGSFNKAQSVVHIGVLLMNLGVQPAMVKYLAQFRYEEKDGYLRVFIESGILIITSVSILMTLIVYFSSGYIANEIFNEPEQEIYIKYLSIGILCTAFSNIAQGITVGYERMELRSSISVIYSFVKSLVSPVLVYIGLGTLGAILGHISPLLLSGAIGFLFIVMIYRNQKPVERSISHLDAVKMILTYGFPLYLSSLLGGILPQLYTTLLGVWETNEKIGNYSVALNFSVLLSFVTLPISTTIFPLFSKLEKNQNELEFLYKNAVKYSTLLGYPIIFTIVALADQIIAVLFRANYLYAAHYLRIYMLTFLLIGLGSVANGSLLNGQNRNDVNLKSTAAKFIVALPLSYFSIQKYGVVGLLYTYFVTGFVNASINLMYIRRVFGFKINLRFFMKMLVISFVSCFAVYKVFTFVSVNPWVELFAGGLLSVLIYLIGVVLFRALSKQDYNYLSRLSDSFGPFAPMVRLVIDYLSRFS